jgi:hypothetical protein
MKTHTFKNQVRNIKESLRGNTLTVYGYGAKKSFTTLKSFGDYILSIIEDDSSCFINGNEFFIYPKFDMYKAIQEFGTSA